MDFSYVVGEAFGNTISILLSVLLISLLVVLFVSWAIVPFILVSIRKKLSDIDEKLSRMVKDE